MKSNVVPLQTIFPNVGLEKNILLMPFLRGDGQRDMSSTNFHPNMTSTITYVMMISIMNEKELYLFHDLQALNMIGKTEFDHFMLLVYQYVMELRYIVQLSCARLYIYFSLLIKSGKESIFLAKCI